MALITCKIHLKLYWTKNFAMSHNNDETTFKITNTKLYVPIVTISTKDNINLTKQFNEGFKRSAYSKEYKIKIEPKKIDDNNLTKFYLDTSFQGVRRLFVLAFDNTDDDAKKVERNDYEIFSSKSKYN